MPSSRLLRRSNRFPGPAGDSFAKKGMKLSMQIATRTLAATLLIAADLIGPHIQAQTAQIPAGPAGGVAAAMMPDVEGVHLGMSVAQATAVMKTVFPAAGLQVLYSNYLQGPTWISSLKGQSQDQTDFVWVYFSMPPNPQQVIFIQRTLILPPGKQPTQANTLAGLRQKYGADLTNTNPRVGVLAWAWDEQGQPASPQGPVNWNPADCANQLMGTSGGQPDPKSPLEVNDLVGSVPLAQRMPGYVKDLCNRNVFASAQMLLSSIQGTPVVNQMHINLGEKPLALRDVVAAEQSLEAQGAAKQKQQLKDAEQNKVGPL